MNLEKIKIVKYIIISFFFVSILQGKDILKEERVKLEKSFNSETILSLSNILLMQNINLYFDDNPLKKMAKRDMNFCKKRDLKVYSKEHSCFLSKRTDKNNRLLSSYLPLFDKNNNMGRILNYYVIGAFKSRGDFEKVLSPEINFNSKDILDGKTQKVNWKKIENYNNGYINFGEILNLNSNSLNYLLTFINIKSSGKYQIRFSSKSKTKLFLDKKEIFYKKYNSFSYPDQEILLVYLEKGVHSLLFKVKNDKGSGIYLRVLSNHGEKSDKISNIFLESYPKKFPKSRLVDKLKITDSLDRAYNAKCDNYKIYHNGGSCRVKSLKKEKDSNYFFKRAIIERRFTSYDKTISPYPFEKYFKQALSLAKSDEEKGKIYYYWSLYGADKNLKIENLNRAVELNYYFAILKKIEDNLNNRYFLNIDKLFKKADKLDMYNYSLLYSKNRYYELLNLKNYYNKRLEKLYKKSKRKSSYFEFLIAKSREQNDKKRIKLFEKSKDKFFFNDRDKLQLLNLYYKEDRFRDYRSYLNLLLRENRFKYQLQLFKFFIANKQYKKFIDLYEENEQLLNDNTIILKLLAEVYQIVGDSSKSEKYFKKYSILKPYDSKVKTHIKTLTKNNSDLWAKKYIDKLKREIPKKVDGDKEILWRDTVIKINKDYSYNFYETVAQRVNSEEAAKSFTRLILYYSPDERIVNSSVKVKKIDGTTVTVSSYRNSNRINQNGKSIYESKYRIYFLPTLSKGDIIEYGYYKVSTDIFYDKPFYSASFKLDSPVLTTQRTITLITPIDMNLYFNQKPKSKKEGYYHFEFKNREYIHENFNSGYSSNFDILVVSTMKDWSEFISWYQNLIKDTLTVPEKIKKEIKNTTKNMKELDKIKYIHKYVTDNIHYIAISLGINGYKPHSVKSVLENRYGDCKDTANLFVALLKIVNIEAYHLVIRTNDLGEIKTTIPQYGYFNHEIAYIPKYDLYVDLTDSHAGLYDMPSMDQHSSAILIKKGEKLRTTKVVNTYKEIIMDSKRVKNDLISNIKITFKSADASNYRYYLSDNKYKEHIETLLPKKILINNKIENIKIKNIKDKNKNLIVNFKLTTKDFFNKKTINSSIFLDYFKNIPLYPKRETEIRVKKRSIEEKIIIKGIKIEENSIEINNQFFKFTANIKYKNSTTIIENSYSWKKVLIPTNQYQEFKKEYLKVIDYLKTELEIEK